MKSPTSNTTTFLIHQFNIAQAYATCQALFWALDCMWAARVKRRRSSHTSSAQRNCVYGASWHGPAGGGYPDVDPHPECVISGGAPQGSCLRGQALFPCPVPRGWWYPAHSIVVLSAPQVQNRPAVTARSGSEPVRQWSPLCAVYHRGNPPKRLTAEEGTYMLLHSLLHLHSCSNGTSKDL